MRVFLAGEGRTDLGDWAREKRNRSSPPVLGCIEVLFGKFAADWSVGGAILWKSIRKAKAGDHRKPEQRNVLGAALAALEAECDALVFVRDDDGDPERRNAIEQGIRDALTDHPQLRLVGGVATRDIEAWVLACRGVRGSEQIRDTKDTLAQLHSIETLEHKSACLSGTSIDSIPEDARSLRLWIERAQALFATS